MAQWSSREVEHLRRVLAELYPERRAAMTLAEDAGLSAADIDFAGSSLEMWGSILRHAKPRDAIDALLERALADNPGNQELLKAQRHEPALALPTGRAGGIALGGVALVLVVAVVLGHSVWTGMQISTLQGKLTQQESELQVIKTDLAKAPFVPVAPFERDREAQDALDNLPSVEETKRLLSQDAVDLILDFEIGSGKGQDLPAHVIGKSLTIGIGYDLGYVTLEQFASDWGARLPAEMLARLYPLVGRRDLPSSYSTEGITIAWQPAFDVFFDSTVRRFVAMVLTLPRASELPPDSFGALVSLVFNRGMSFTNPGDRYTEMRRIHELLASGEFAAIPEQLRAMKRLWPDLPGLQRRRDAEAILFQVGLLKQQLEGLS